MERKENDKKNIENIRERVDEITSKEDISDSEVEELADWVLLEIEILDQK